MKLNTTSSALKSRPAMIGVSAFARTLRDAQEFLHRKRDRGGGDQDRLAEPVARMLGILADRECSVEEVNNRLARGDKFHLIDVREESEWSRGHLPNAVHLGKGVIERDVEVTNVLRADTSALSSSTDCGARRFLWYSLMKRFRRMVCSQGPRMVMSISPGEARGVAELP
mgnify:CR=1 FL=1